MKKDSLLFRKSGRAYVQRAFWEFRRRQWRSIKFTADETWVDQKGGWRVPGKIHHWEEITTITQKKDCVLLAEGGKNPIPR